MFAPLPGEGGSALRGRVWRIGDDIACFEGGVSAQAAHWFEAQIDPIAQLVIRSPGGSGSAGVDIAETLLEWRTDIIVWDFCYSACASYLFVAGRKKIVPEPGVIGFHQGGLAWSRYGTLFTPEAYADPAIRPLAEHAIRRFNQTGRLDIPDPVWASLPPAVRGTRASFPSWRLRIERLYNQVGVRHELLSAHHIIRGRLPMFAADALGAHREGADLMWAPDAAELARWGVANVVMWSPQDPEQVLQLGLDAPEPTINVRAEIDYSYFPFDTHDAVPDDSATWPSYEALPSNSGDQQAGPPL
jgi:hypothetical protein